MDIFNGKASKAPHPPAVFSGPLQMDAFRAALQQTVELWGRFCGDLREASLLTTRLQCSLRNQPLFSLRQTEGHLDSLQVSKPPEMVLAVAMTGELRGVCHAQLLEEESRKVEEVWASVGTSYQSLEHTVHCGTARLLQAQMEEELKRSEDTPLL